MKYALGFVVAPLIVALFVPMAIDFSIEPYPISFYFGSLAVIYAFTATIALPCFLLMSHPQRERAIPIIIAATAVGFASFAALNFLIMPTYSRVGDAVLVEHGWYTFTGLAFLLAQCAGVGAASALGGVVFWLVTKLQIDSNGA